MDKITDETKKKQEVPKYEDAVGIRATLNNMGFSNDKIGYNNASKTVTLDGKDFMKPKYMDENTGVSSAPEADIRNNLVSFYKNNKNPIVKVSDAFSAAAGKYGLDASAMGYGNGSVLIGGQPLNTLYTDEDGKAWAWQDDVYDLTNNYASSIGLSNPNNLLDSYNSDYLTKINDKLDDINNRTEFSYDPKSDPVYLAYRDSYISDGNRASKSAMADYSALTGGYVNSNAVTAGAMANQYYAQQLSNKIPDLAAQAYKQYYDNNQSDIDYVKQMVSAYNMAYGNAADANENARKYANETSNSVVERDNNAREALWKNNENSWTDRKNQQAYDTQEINNFWTNILNRQTQTENDYKNQEHSLDIDEKNIDLEYYRRLLDSKLKESEAKVFSDYN